MYLWRFEEVVHKKNTESLSWINCKSGKKKSEVHSLKTDPCLERLQNQLSPISVSAASVYWIRKRVECPGRGRISALQPRLIRYKRNRDQLSEKDPENTMKWLRRDVTGSETWMYNLLLCATNWKSHTEETKSATCSYCNRFAQLLMSFLHSLREGSGQCKQIRSQFKTKSLHYKWWFFFTLFSVWFKPSYQSVVSNEWSV